MRRNRGNKNANDDNGILSLGNPLQGLSDVIFGGCGCGCDCGRDGRDGRDGKDGKPGCCCCCCIGGGSGHLIDESEIVL